MTEEKNTPEVDTEKEPIEVVEEAEVAAEEKEAEAIKESPRKIRKKTTCAPC